MIYLLRLKAQQIHLIKMYLRMILQNKDSIGKREQVTFCTQNQEFNYIYIWFTLTWEHLIIFKELFKCVMRNCHEVIYNYLLTT